MGLLGPHVLSFVVFAEHKKLVDDNPTGGDSFGSRSHVLQLSSLMKVG